MWKYYYKNKEVKIIKMIPHEHPSLGKNMAEIRLPNGKEKLVLTNELTEIWTNKGEKQ